MKWHLPQADIVISMQLAASCQCKEAGRDIVHFLDHIQALALLMKKALLHPNPLRDKLGLLICACPPVLTPRRLTILAMSHAASPLGQRFRSF